MTYIIESEYILYTGESSIPDDFSLLAEIASNQINQSTFYRLGNELTGLNEDMVKNVKKATALQVKYLALKGGRISLLAQESGIKTAKIGNFSYTLDDKGSGSSGDNLDIAPASAILLDSLFLRSSGVGLCL